MDKILIHICTKNGDIAYSNLPKTLYKEYSNCKKEYEYIENCSIYKIPKRHGVIKTDKGSIYLCIYTSNITSKIFKHYLTLCRLILDLITIKDISQKNVLVDKMNRLEHNIVSYLKKIQDRLDSIIPEKTINYKDWKSTKNTISELITKNTDSYVSSMFHILKNMKLLKSEIDVFDFFEYGIEDIIKHEHPIHKIVNLSLQAFWIDFVQKNIKINIGSCLEYAMLDYSSFSVVMGHIFDNATKYTLKDTTLDISFISKNEFIIIEFKMTSLAIEKNEIELIFNENYSGINARKHELEGHGIGMYYAKKIMNLHNGFIEFIPGKSNFYFDGIPYSDNVIKIGLEKKVNNL